MLILRIGQEIPVLTSNPKAAFEDEGWADVVGDGSGAAVEDEGLADVVVDGRWACVDWNGIDDSVEDGLSALTVVFCDMFFKIGYVFKATAK